MLISVSASVECPTYPQIANWLIKNQYTKVGELSNDHTKAVVETWEGAHSQSVLVLHESFEGVVNLNRYTADMTNTLETLARHFRGIVDAYSIAKEMTSAT